MGFEKECEGAAGGADVEIKYCEHIRGLKYSAVEDSNSSTRHVPACPSSRHVVHQSRESAP
jgi:hypothetical protein